MTPKFNPYKRYEALGYYAGTVSHAKSKIEHILTFDKNLDFATEKHLKVVLADLNAALDFDKKNEAENEAAFKAHINS